MVDDIGRPRPQSDERQNKNAINPPTPEKPLEVPHLYQAEAGFTAAEAAMKKRQKLWQWPHLSLKRATKKQRIIGSALIAVLLLGGGTGVYALHQALSKDQPAPVAQKVETPTPAPATEASKLTGVQIAPELNKRPVTGIMIENSPDARPQSALKDAGVVYEAIAEGGITRFLALFQESQPDYIGPVRSVRPYYVDLLLPYDASIVHAGGSAEGLAKVRAMGVKDIDHGANGGAFRRVSDRYAPHNLYTSMAALDQVSAARGYTTSNVKSLERKAEKPSPQITARTINIGISSPLYNLRYDYDPATNSYKRFLAGRPHTDHRSGQQLAPKTVVTLAMGYSQKGIYSVYQTTGKGQAFIFQDGAVQAVHWSRANEREQFVFTDDAGKKIALNAGQTWFTLVKNPGHVSFSP
jgi:Protein of unknown function (DUF3048) N-terminal domain/Protein of unknown function (DUF3048) C-terminal domain